MRGQAVKPLRSASPERAILAAIVGQALRDAQRGDAEAADWLDDVGPLFCGVLGLDEAAAADWRNANLQARAPIDEERRLAMGRERNRRRDAKKRAARLAPGKA